MHNSIRFQFEREPSNLIYDRSVSLQSRDRKGAGLQRHMTRAIIANPSRAIVEKVPA